MTVLVAALLILGADPRHKPECEQMLYPAVRVSTGTAGGSGTILYSEDRGDGLSTYVLTNHHVVEGAIHITSEWSSLLQQDVKRERNDPVTVEVFRYFEGSRQDVMDSYRAEIVAHSREHDLAIVRLKSSRKLDHVAKLLPTTESVEVFDPIWAIGCSLSHPPVVTCGVVDYLDDTIDKKLYWMGSAPIIYGNSGGGVFLERGGQFYFIGVPSRVAVTVNQAVTHMGYFVPIPRIREWLREEQLTFLVEPKTTPTECFERRDELRKAAERRKSAEFRAAAKAGT